MRTLQFALLAALLTLGCRSNNTQVLVEQEARVLEDEVYHLEAQLDECCRAREAALRENADLKKQLADGRPSGGSGTGGDYQAPVIELPGRDKGPPKGTTPQLEPPKIELPESTTPPGNLAPPGNEQPAVEGPPAKLSINNRLTGGLDHDNAGGDEGIMVMVEPRDAQGRLVKSPGAVSVVVMDPAQSGEEARVARWDFQAHEFAEHFKTSTFGRGLQYELKWPGEPPKHRNLVLFVRYITDDGTKITADAPLVVRMPSDSRPVSTAEEDRQESGPRSRLKSRGNAVGPKGRQARGGRPQWQPFR